MAPELPNEDEQLSHLLFIDEFMTTCGFDHYEISNFCKPGHRARHNMNYWTGTSYLGLGPSAHSYDAISKKRWKNVSSLHKYSQLLEEGKSPIEWEETLNSEQQDLEKWMLAIRLKEGFPSEWAQTAAQKAKITSLKQEGLLIEREGPSPGWQCTPKGFSLSDHIVKILS
jgi:oxygen-independent coproporphyrinogen-3 oxidase